MITNEQITELEQYYQIDNITIVREYLQLLFLNYLYQEKQASQIYFKGGTAIHLIYNSGRFSEDLDFSTIYTIEQLKFLLTKIEKSINQELKRITIKLLYHGKRSIRFRLIYLNPNFKYPLTIRIDFNQENFFLPAVTTTLFTKFPLIFFPLINQLSAEEILAEKIRALLLRGKGRDLYDTWFLLKKDIKINQSLLAEKLKAVGKKFNSQTLNEKIAGFSLKKLNQDLVQFLPLSQRRIIPILAKETAVLLFSSLPPPED